MHEAVASLTELRGLALYQQFIVLMMLAYGVLMVGVGAMFAAGGNVFAVVALGVGVGVGVAAVTVVPDRLASGE